VKASLRFLERGKLTMIIKPYYRTYTPEEERQQAFEYLEMDARRAGLDLNASSEQMFRCSPEALDEPQRRILKGMFYEAYLAKHKHFCIECGDPIRCDVEGCTQTDGYDHCADEIESRSNRWLHNRAEVMR
jgi:hypothetical protein